MQTHERSQSKRPRLLAIHARHDNRCISDQICNRSINRTSNLEFLYRGKSDTIGIDDPAPIDQMRPLSYFFFFLSSLLVFRFRNAVMFLFHPDGHILRGRIYFWKRIKQISEEGFPKESGKRSICINWNVYKSVYFHNENFNRSLYDAIAPLSPTVFFVPSSWRRGRRKRSDMIWFSQQRFVSLLCHHRHLYPLFQGTKKRVEKGLRQNNICLAPKPTTNSTGKIDRHPPPHSGVLNGVSRISIAGKLDKAKTLGIRPLTVDGFKLGVPLCKALEPPSFSIWR